MSLILAGMRTLTLSTPQLRRAQILTHLIAGQLSTTDAAQLLVVLQQLLSSYNLTFSSSIIFQESYL
jgi:hypothetical protein